MIFAKFTSAAAKSAACVAALLWAGKEVFNSTEAQVPQEIRAVRFILVDKLGNDIAFLQESRGAVELRMPPKGGAYGASLRAGPEGAELELVGNDGAYAKLSCIQRLRKWDNTATECCSLSLSTEKGSGLMEVDGNGYCRTEVRSKLTGMALQLRVPNSPISFITVEDRGSTIAELGVARVYQGLSVDDSRYAITRTFTNGFGDSDYISSSGVEIPAVSSRPKPK